MLIYGKGYCSCYIWRVLTVKVVTGVALCYSDIRLGGLIYLHVHTVIMSSSSVLK